MTETEFGDSVYESGVEDAEDFDPVESLTGDDPDEPFDTSYSPPDHRPSATRWGTTDFEQAQGEPLDLRLSEEEPDIDVDGGALDVADRRAGRIVQPDEGAHSDTESEAIATDVGTAGYGSSAEEAAMHVIEADDLVEDFVVEESLDEDTSEH
jgi:Family of unknown function (DUF5709)